MIYLYSGTPGSGKSYHAALDVYHRLQNNRRVIANTMYNCSMLKGKRNEKFFYRDNSEMNVKFLVEFAEKYHKQGVEGQTLLIIDECSVLFNTRDYGRKDRMDWIVFFQQHRKLGYNIILISQNDKLIDKQIRVFVEYDVRHRNVKRFKMLGLLLSLLGGGSLFVAVSYWYGMRERVASEFFTYRRKIARFYNTWEIHEYKKDKGVQR